MVSLTVKLLTKNKPENEKRAITGKICGAFGIAFNVLLFLAKLICGLISGSISIMADAFNNLSDAGSSVVTLVGFRLSEKKPDPHHPFGHGRMEYVSGLIVSFMIILMGIELFKSSVSGLIEPVLPEFGALTTVILSASILVKLYIFLYNRRIGKQIDSAAMLATASDSLGDMISTSVVLASSIICRFTGFVYLDAICGLALSVFILIAGVRAASETISPLLGQSPSAELVDSIAAIAREDARIIGIHDMVIHDYGPGRVMVSLHCEVSSDEDVIELHELIDGIEGRIAERFNCTAIIHMDPIDTHDDVLQRLRPIVADAVKKLDENAGFHDLRVVRASGHINVLFDILLPYGCDISPEKAAELAAAEIKKADESYHCIIKVENDYVGRNS